MDDEDDSKIFPQKLMDILSEPESQEAISWLPHGKGFIVRNRKQFAETVMPRYFSRKAKYSSFTRKLNRWNFIRVSSGTELGAYHHKFFLRDKPHLAAQMFCKNARTMLAMASVDNQSDVVAEKPPSPTPPPVLAPPTTPQLNQTPPIWALSKGHPEKVQCQKSPSAATALTAPFGGATSLQLLERQMQYLQQQKEQADRLLMERAMLMQMMQVDMQKQRARNQPSNNRASAA